MIIWISLATDRQTDSTGTNKKRVISRNRRIIIYLFSHKTRIVVVIPNLSKTDTNLYLTTMSWYLGEVRPGGKCHMPRHPSTA